MNAKHLFFVFVSYQQVEQKLFQMIRVKSKVHESKMFFLINVKIRSVKRSINKVWENDENKMKFSTFIT